MSRNPLLTEVDIDTLASTKDEGDLPADAVVKRSVATADRLAFLSGEKNRHAIERVSRRWRGGRALVAEERAEAIKRVRDHVAPGPKPQTELPTRLALSASELERVKPPALDPPELELLGYDSMPPLPIVATFTCLHLVLNPEAVKTHGRGLPDAQVLQSRPLRHTLLKAPRKLATQLQAFDASRRLPREVLQLLWPVLNRRTVHGRGSDGALRSRRRRVCVAERSCGSARHEDRGRRSPVQNQGAVRRPGRGGGHWPGCGR